ncbi:AAA family ATPase [Mycobacterium avium]|uniref:AAA family ATPase n=2 Tax=Mycobacterium avium TaxID=1764 RepID=UPI000777F93C|nr:AAA family ATPase [Mycobacterium avium]MBZ4518043.1 AAA family ATPase [Mycobacterium avium subsp. hominissuis]MBZ4527863.1 AAA family ATPase [Mycobacterium avium subsp. hominissuis]MBZ4547096.1 AAA family ATPase [Mycobacterium avium subsp. hominissuis]MBZ4556856.1 AAA family ATPase [Mycobacterium avium subsp. hominissuis]MBZ4566394.1 AAA family ATPase [Mycobacterium avium subsp. hominissuis]
MKLHRLTLTNYRGIAHREIEFPDHGVVVVCGANEIGKSSMIEALDLLLEAKDRSTKKEVKQVKPTHSDVGAEVSAEISCGPYRFVYRKRFHKKCETELTVITPYREQLTGDEAHERVRAMLAETVDSDLWHAQRVLQAASTAAVDLSGCDALSRALDVAAGDSGGLCGTEPLLIERIDAEYARYFTPTGRPTGEWAAAIARLADAEAAVAECAAAVAEVDERVSRHAALTEQVADLSQRRIATGPRVTAARQAADRIAELTAQRREAQLVAEAAAATKAAAAQAHTGRLQLLADIDSRAAAVTQTQAQVQQAAADHAAAQADAQACDTALQHATEALAELERRVQEAQRTVERLAGREEADRLAARLDKIDAIQRDRERISAELSTIAVTEELLRRIEDAAAAVDRIGDQLASTSAAVEFTAAADIHLVIGDQQVSLPAGQSWSITAAGPTAVEVPGVLTARVTPGATTLDVQAKHAAAQQELAAALTAGAVADLAAARSADQRRRELQGTRDQLGATLAGLCGDEPLDELRSRLARLRAEHPEQRAEPTDGAADLAAARTELEALAQARACASAECDTRRQAATAAAARLAETATAATVLQNRLDTLRAELDAATGRLAAERASVGDEELAASADAALRAEQAAERRVAELADALAAASPDSVAAELADATQESESLRERYEEAAGALREVTIELSVFGSEGRQGKLDAAETEREHAASEHSQVGRRARAAQLLRSVMTRHRDTTRQRYVEPYRAELQRLGRPVFGPTFEVDIDSDLCIRSRTLNGITVPYESLSGGAKEQLGILARLAGAALVAKEDAVPVVVDDALGFTDPDRLAKMGQLFDSVGSHGQVIVLTCSPDRYDGVKGAHRIDLSA